MAEQAQATQTTPAPSATAAAPPDAQAAPPAQAATQTQAPPPAAVAHAGAAAPQAQTQAPAAPGTPPAQQAAQATDSPKAAPAVPEKYDLKLPEKSLLNPSQLEKIADFAKSRGLSNEQAQTIVERESEAVRTFSDSQQQTLKQAQSGWLETAQHDSEIGGEAFTQNVELAKRVVAKFGTDAFKQELDKTGFGNHPELLRVFVRLGKSMGDDELIMPGSTASEKQDPTEILYDHPSSRRKG